MNAIDFVVLALVAAIVALAALYLYKAKSKGVKCIGCPDGAKCSGSCTGCSGNCGGQQNGSSDK